MKVDLPSVETVDIWRSAVTLFSESASRVVVSAASQDLPALLARAAEFGVPAQHIGTTEPGRITVLINGRPAIDMPVAEAEVVWDSALETYFKQRAA